jgi:hypothetical protein
MKYLIIILFTLASLAAHAQGYIGADGALHPTGSFPITYSADVKGAPKRVTTKAQRDAIPASLRDTGMICYVTALDSMYMLSGGTANANWKAFTSGSTTIASSGNALIATVAANGISKIIAVRTGANAVASVQVVSNNGTGMQYWRNSGDSTFMFYGDAPDSIITYSIAIIGSIDSTVLANGNGNGTGTGNGSGGGTDTTTNNNGNGNGTDTTSNNNNNGGGGGGGGTNGAWTYVIDTSCQTKYGAQVGFASSTANMTALANIGVSYARANYYGSGTPSYPTYTAGGYNILLTYNPATPGNYTTLPTDSLAFRNNIKSLITANGSTNVAGGALINEWNNTQHGKGLWNPGSAQNIINLLRAGGNALHEMGLKAYDGGVTGDPLNFLVYEDYVNRGFTDSANTFAVSVFPAGTVLTNWRTDTAHGYRVKFTDSVLTAMQTLPLDGINMHFYATVLASDSTDATIDPGVFKSIVHYLHRKTNKPVITNEFGTNNNTNADIQSQLIDAIEQLHDAKNGDMSIAIWFGADNNHPIANADGSLTTYGTALKTKIQDTHVN